jgi:hypothetical protein
MFSSSVKAFELFPSSPKGVPYASSETNRVLQLPHRIILRQRAGELGTNPTLAHATVVLKGNPIVVSIQFRDLHGRCRRH